MRPHLWLPSEHSLAFPSQVEMFLLAYAVRHTIQVYRLSKYNTEEFVTVYPTEPPKDWPVVTLIAEDDRHYNIPVRVCEETSLWETPCGQPVRDSTGAHAAPSLGPQGCSSRGNPGKPLGPEDELLITRSSHVIVLSVTQCVHWGFSTCLWEVQTTSL